MTVISWRQVFIAHLYVDDNSARNLTLTVQNFRTTVMLSFDKHTSAACGWAPAQHLLARRLSISATGKTHDWFTVIAASRASAPSRASSIDESCGRYGQ